MNRSKKSPTRSVSLHFESLESRLALSGSPLASLVTALSHVPNLSNRASASAIVQSISTKVEHRVEQLQSALIQIAHVNPASTVTPTFTEKNLVSDQSGVGRFTDPNLVNAWGLAESRSGLYWVANNGTGKVSLYSPSGFPLPLAVTIPQANGTATGGTPTGVVVNNSSEDFLLQNGHRSRFITVTADGAIVAWGASLGTRAEVEVDNSEVPTAEEGAVYTGVATGKFDGNTYLYATNFRTGTIDVFDSHFNQVTSLPGDFTDPGPFPTPPDDAAGFAPFNIRNLDGKLYVTYAAHDSDGEDEVASAGAGFVDVFNTDGTFVQRLTTGGTLNAPWGLEQAPDHFGTFSKAILVGNFGDGTISAFNPTTGAFLGQLTDLSGAPIQIDGLWGLDFSHSLRSQGRRLFFAAGPEDETHGLFGKLSLNHQKYEWTADIRVQSR